MIAMLYVLGIGVADGNAKMATVPNKWVKVVNVM